MPKRTHELLIKLKAKYTEILGKNLVGIYLHGSYALNSYNEQVSDLDYIVVVKHPLCFTEKQALMKATLTDLWPLTPAKGLEFHVLLLTDTLHFKAPLPFDLHFSKMHYSAYLANPKHYIETMVGTDPDLAAHLTILTKAGKVLTGTPIVAVFGPVPVKDYWDSILFDVANAPQTITKQPTYTVLNLCRVLAFRRSGQVLSKDAGGQWGLKHLPSNDHALIKMALTAYRGATPQPIIQYSDANLIAFATRMLAQIKPELPY